MVAELTLNQAIAQSHVVELPQERSSNGLPKGFKKTKTFGDILETIEYGRSVYVPLMLITGAFGVGKTETLKYVCNKAEMSYWEAAPKTDLKDLAYTVCDLIGVTTGTSWRVQTSVAVSRLREFPMCIAIDEAQRMNYDCFDWLKYVSDQSKNHVTGTRASFILSGSPSLEKRIDKWPDISTRCAVRKHVGPLELAEFLRLYKHDGFDEATLREIHRVSKGVLRVIQHILSAFAKAQHLYKQETGKTIGNAVFTKEDVNTAAERIVFHGE